MSGSKSQQSILERIRGGLIVSCQALPEEPLHSSYIMGRMLCSKGRRGGRNPGQHSGGHNRDKENSGPSCDWNY